MPGTVQLSIRAARALAMRAQGFGRAPRPLGAAALAGLATRLAAIQIDSINVVARAHLLTPWSRSGPYDPAVFATAAYTQRRIYEGWAHEACFLPMAEWRWLTHRRAWYQGWHRFRTLREERADLVADVLGRIGAEGPLPASAFAAAGTKRGPWWDWQPAKIILEGLFGVGELMVARRRSSFEREYDLTERVLPRAVDTTPPTQEEERRYHAGRALRALGVGTSAHIAEFYRYNRARLPRIMAELVEAGEALPATVAGEPGWFVPADTPSTRTVRGAYLLAPFDSLLWDRDRLQRLWGWRFRLEAYTPPAKRVHGYYVFSLLLDGAFVARLDLKADRAAKTLLLRLLTVEDALADVGPAVASTLGSLAAFLGLDAVAVERVVPEESRGGVLAALRAGGLLVSPR